MTRKEKAIRQLMAYVIFGQHRGWPVLTCRPDRVEGLSPHVARARGPLHIELDERSSIASDGITVPVGKLWKRKGRRAEDVLFVPWNAIDDVRHGGQRGELMPLRYARDVPKLDVEQRPCPKPGARNHGVYCGCAGVSTVGITSTEPAGPAIPPINATTAAGKRVRMSDANESWHRYGATDYGPWTVEACDCGMCKLGTHVATTCGRHICVYGMVWADDCG